MESTEFWVLDRAGRVFGDTSFFFASLDPEERRHSEALEISRQIRLRGIEIVTTWEIAVECVTLLRYRLGFAESKQFLSEIVPTLTIFYAGEADRKAAIDFYLKRTPAGPPG